MTSPGGKPVAQVSVRVVPDTGGFSEKLRRELADIRDLTVEVKLDEDALRRQLESIDDITIKVNFDVDNLQDDINRATAGAKAGKIKVPVEADDAALNRALADAGKNVKPVKVPAELDDHDLEAQIARINQQIHDLSNEPRSLEVIIQGDALREQLRQLKGELTTFAAETYDVQVGADGTGEVLAAITSIREAADAAGRDPVLFRLELDQAQLESEIAQVRAELALLDDQVATPEVRLARVRFEADLRRLTAELETLDSRRIDIVANMDLDTAAARAEIALFRARQRSNPINIPVDIDRSRADIAINGIFHSLGGVTGALGHAFNSVFSGLGSAADSVSGHFAGMGEELGRVLGFAGQLIVPLGQAGALAAALAVAGAAITAAYGAAATAVAALPAAIGLVGAAGVAVVLGLDGIKKAAKSIKPEFDALKASVSATFERGLTPIFQNLATVFPKIKDSINNVADALVNSAFSFTRFLTSSRGVATLNTIFNNTAQALRDMQPGLDDIVQTFLTLAAQGGVFDALTSAVNTFGRRFKENVTQQLRDNTLTRAFEGLKGLLDQLTLGFADLVKNGISVFAAAAPGVNSFFRSLTGFFDRFNWDSLGKSVGGVFEGLGKALDGVDTATIRDIESAFGDLADTFNDPKFQENLQTMIKGIGPAIRQGGELIRFFGEVGAAISEALIWFDKADQKFRGFIDWWNGLGVDENGNGILTADAKWWQDLIDQWDGFIQKIKDAWDSFIGWFSNRGVPKTQHGAIGGGGNPFGDFFKFDLPELPTFGDLEPPKLGPGWDHLRDDVKRIFDDVVKAARTGTQDLQDIVSAGMDKVRSAFAFTSVGTSWGQTFLRLVGTTKLGMESLAATVTDGMPSVIAAFNFAGIDLTLGLAFLDMVGTIRLGMDSLAVAVTEKMPTVLAAFNFSSINLTLGLAFIGMTNTARLGMDSLAVAVTEKMPVVLAAFNFASIDLTLGLAFIGMTNTTRLGMDSIAAAVTEKMPVVLAAFNFASINLTLGLAFVGMVGTVRLGMDAIAVAVTEGVAKIRAAWDAAWAGSIISTVVGAWARIIASVAGGIASVVTSISGGLRQLVSFWTTNWGIVGDIVRGAMSGNVAEVVGGMGRLVASVAGGAVRFVAEFAGMAERGLTALRGMIASAVTVGAGIISGLVGAIAAGAGRVIGALGDLASRALAAAKAKLGIASPSREFMKIGAFVTEGFALGIEQSAPKAIGAINQMADSALGAADQITAAFSGDQWASDFNAKIEHSFADATATMSTKDVVGQLRALNGNVDQSSYLSRIALLLEAIYAQGQGSGGSAALGAQSSRADSVLGTF